MNIKNMRNKTTAGFSLIELLISIMLMGILMSAYASLFRVSLQGWMRTIGSFERSQAVGDAFDRLNMDFRSALPPYFENEGENNSYKLRFLAYDENGSPSKTLTSSPTQYSMQDEVQFHAAGWTSSEGTYQTNGVINANPGSEITRRGYWLRQNWAGGALRVQEGHNIGKRTKYIDDIPSGFTIQDAYALSVSKFNMEYSADGTNFSDVWDSDGQGYNQKLPKLIRITMVAERMGDTSAVVHIVHPRANGAYINK